MHINKRQSKMTVDIIYSLSKNILFTYTGVAVEDFWGIALRADIFSVAFGTVFHRRTF